MALKLVAKKSSVEVEVSPVIGFVVLPQKVLVQTPPVSEIEALTTEYVELYKKFDYFEVKALVKRMDEIRKQLLAVANETVEANKPAVFACVQGEVEFSERAKISEVPEPLELIKVLLEKFGPEVTTSIVDIAMTPLRKIMSEFELKKFVTEQPGGRILRAVRIS